MMRTKRLVIVGSLRSNFDHGASDRGGRRRATAFVCCLTALCVALLAFMVVPPVAARTTARFVSKLYRYSIVLSGATSRWSPIFATQRWLGDSLPGIPDPELDTFIDPRTGRTYLLAARPTRSRLEKWTKFVIAARPSVCGHARRPRRAKFGGERAQVVRWSCADGYRVIVITALHARRGYFMLVASPTALSRTSDLPAFNAARKSFRFSR